MALAPREVEQPRTDYEADSAPAVGTAAFGRLYKQHFDGLYDFVARMVHDRDLAGEIVQNTFTKAWDELRAGHELRHPKSWLYIVARNGALDELRRRSRLAGEPLVYAKADTSRLADPQAVAEDNELVELVWTSAEALTPDEYSLLDMHVRRGFDAEQLADALELERGAVYTRLSRLRRSLEESVASTLLVRRGRERCPELACIVAEHQAGDKITPALRRAVHEHVRNCDICADTRRRAVSPVALFGALIPVVPLAGMRDAIFGGIVGDGGHAAAAAGAAGGGAAIATTRHASKARYLAPMGAVAAAGAIVAAVALSSGAHVADPAQASSVDHTPGVASPDRTVSMRWSPGKNAKGYSVMFSRNRSDEPPARENVTGTSFTSQPLAPGRWWFILRTHGRKGGWTDTLRVGPFVITAPVAAKPPPAAKAHPKKRAARKAAHRRVARAAKHGTTVVAAARTAPAQPVTPQTSNPAPPKAGPKPKAKPKPKPKPKSKGKPPPKSHPPPATSPPATTPPATTSPPVTQPVTQTPPVVTPPGEQGGGNDSENDDDQDDQGGDHGGNGGDGNGGHGEGHGHGGG